MAVRNDFGPSKRRPRLSETRSRILIAACLALAIPDGHAQPATGGAGTEVVMAARASDPLFLTDAVADTVTLNGEPGQKWTPGQKKLTFGWSDQPFAINVPFDIAPLVDNGIVLGSRHYKVSLNWRGFGAAKNKQDFTGYSPIVIASGYYRLDGKPVHANSTDKIFIQTDEAVVPPNLELVRNARQGKKPQSLRTYDLVGPAHAVFWMVVDPRKGFSTDAWAGNEILDGTLEASVEDVLSQESKVARHLDFKIKQNGWALADMKVSWHGNLNRKVTAGDGTKYKFLDAGQEFKAGTLTARHSFAEVLGADSQPASTDAKSEASGSPDSQSAPTEAKPEGSDTPARQAVPTDVMVKVTLPPKLLDFSKAQGSVELKEASGSGAPDDMHCGLSETDSIVVTAYGYQPDQTPAAPTTPTTASTSKPTLAVSTPTSAVPAPAARIFGDSSTAHFNAFALGPPDKATGLHDATWDLGFGPAEAVLPRDWRADQPVKQHRLLSIDIGYFDPSGSAQGSVTRHLDIFANRLSSLEDNAAGQVATEGEVKVAATKQRDDDGFYDWMARMNDERESVDQRIQEIMLELRADRGETQNARAKWFKLMRLDMQSFPQDASPQDSLFNAGFTAAGRILTGGRDIPLQPTLTKAALDELKQSRDEQLAKASALHAEQGALIAEANKLLQGLVETADFQTISSREQPDHLKQVDEAVDYYKDRRDVTRLYLYDAAGWDDSNEMRQAIQDLQFAEKSTRELAKLMEAKGYLSEARKDEMKLALALASPTPVPAHSPVEVLGQTARINAMNSLREVLKLSPKNAEARALLQDVELELLSWIPAKLDRERAISIADFNKYLTERGYSADQPEGWWDGFKEFASVLWGSSPVTLGAGITWQSTADPADPAQAAKSQSTADLAANITDLSQSAIAKNQVSLLAIRRLIKTGMSLADIRNISTDELAARMSFNTLERTPLDKAKARRLCQDIHETFAELYDLSALAEGDAAKFQEFLTRNYYQSFNPEKTWCESIGDFFFSPQSLLLFLGPGAVVRVGGEWRLLSMPTEAIAEGAKIETARDLFATTLKLEQLGQKITSTRAGAALADAIIADQAFLASRSGLEQFLSKGGRLGATVVLYCGASGLAEESNIPGLKLLVDALGALGAEEMAFDILSRNGTPLRKLVTKVDAFAAVVAAEKAEAVEMAQGIEKIEAIEQRISAAGAPGTVLPNAEEFKALEAIVEKSGPKQGTLTVPGGNKKANANKTLKNAVDALKQGETAEAKRALATAKKLNKEVLVTLDAYGLALAAARANLEANPVLRKIAANREFKPMGATKQPPPVLPVEGMPSGPAGQYAKFGDDALRSGRLDEALDLYRQAAHEARQAGSAEAETFADNRLALASKAQSEAEAMQVLRDAAKAKSPATAAITEDLRNAVVDEIKSGTLKMVPGPGSKNPVFFIKDQSGKVLYLFKHDLNESANACEVFASLAADKVGLRAAGCQRVKLPGHMLEVADMIAGKRVNVRMEEASGILLRAIDGVELMGQSEAVLLAQKAEYAEQRAFRAWLADTDGHFRNILQGMDGHIWPIDFGFGSISGDGIMRQGDQKFATQLELLRNAVEYPNSVSTLYPIDEANLYHWVNAMDGALSYDEMIGTVDRIKALCNENGGSGLREILKGVVPPNEVDDAFKALVERANALQEVLSKKFPAIDQSVRNRLHTSILPRSSIPVVIGTVKWTPPEPCDFRLLSRSNSLALAA